MKLIVICVFFPPLKSSAAIQVNDLVSEFINQGHSISVITYSNSVKGPYEISKKTGFAPAVTIDPTVAINVNGVVITSSPGPMLNAFKTKNKASVPFPTEIVNFDPFF